MSSIYCKAMEATTQAQADAMMRRLIAKCMKARPCTKKEAAAIQRQNLGYFAGYYGREVRARVERLYDCAHPIFGPIADNGEPTNEQAFRMGLDLAKRMKGLPS
jgi:hypothetical protein